MPRCLGGVKDERLLMAYISLTYRKMSVITCSISDKQNAIKTCSYCAHALKVHNCTSLIHTHTHTYTFTLWSLRGERRWRRYRRRGREPPTPYLQVYSPPPLLISSLPLSLHLSALRLRAVVVLSVLLERKRKGISNIIHES